MPYELPAQTIAGYEKDVRHRTVVRLVDLCDVMGEPVLVLLARALSCVGRRDDVTTAVRQQVLTQARQRVADAATVLALTEAEALIRSHPDTSPVSEVKPDPTGV